MEARSNIKLSVGLILIEIKTERLWQITYESTPKAVRNSGGTTSKKSRVYNLESLDGKGKWSYVCRGDILNKFRLPETFVEKTLYGSNK